MNARCGLRGAKVTLGLFHSMGQRREGYYLPFFISGLQPVAPHAAAADRVGAGATEEGGGGFASFPGPTAFAFPAVAVGAVSPMAGAPGGAAAVDAAGGVAAAADAACPGGSAEAGAVDWTASGTGAADSLRLQPAPLTERAARAARKVSNESDFVMP